MSNQKDTTEATKPDAAIDSARLLGVRAKCSFCSCEKSAMSNHGVHACHSCLRFILYRAEMHDRTPIDQFDIDTLYLSRA